MSSTVIESVTRIAPLGLELREQHVVLQTHVLGQVAGELIQSTVKPGPGAAGPVGQGQVCGQSEDLGQLAVMRGC